MCRVRIHAKHCAGWDLPHLPVGFVNDGLVGGNSLRAQCGWWVQAKTFLYDGGEVRKFFDLGAGRDHIRVGYCVGKLLF